MSIAETGSTKYARMWRSRTMGRMGRKSTTACNTLDAQARGPSSRIAGYSQSSQTNEIRRGQAARSMNVVCIGELALEQDDVLAEASSSKLELWCSL
jgi:hypothetical protein